MQYEQGPLPVSYNIQEPLRPDILRPLTPDQLAQFPDATSKLHLNAVHTAIIVNDEIDTEWEARYWLRGYTKNEERTQHVECLDCREKKCRANMMKVGDPELMMLGFGWIESYDGEPPPRDRNAPHLL